MIRFLLSIEGIIGIVVSIVVAIIVAFILLYIFVFSKRIRNKKIRDLELKYSYFHGVMIGECSQILKRLEIISHSNLLYSEIYSKNVKKSLEILQYNDPKASKALSDALDYILNPSKKDFKKVYEESKLVLDDYEEKVKNFRDELKKIIQPEEDARNAALKVKEFESNVRKKYIVNKSSFEVADETIDLILNKVDRKFEKFNDLIDSAQYEEALKMLPLLNKVLTELNDAIEKLPDLCLEINENIPQKISSVKEKIASMEEEKISLYNINPKKRIKQFKDQIAQININLAKLDLNEASRRIDILNLDVKNLEDLLNKESEAKNYYDNNFAEIVKESKKISGDIISIYNKIPKYEKYYIFNDSHKNILEVFQENERKLANAKTQLDLATLTANRQPFSLIYDKLIVLKKEIDNTNSIISEFENYIKQLKNDCDKAYDLLNIEYVSLKSKKTLLVKLKLNDEEDYLKRFERCFELLNNISEQINNKPINVEILNHDLTEYKALKEDLFINIDNCQSIVNEIDRMVLELNKLRDGFKDINDEIVKAENLYKKSYYVESYDILKKLYDSRKELLNN